MVNHECEINREPLLIHSINRSTKNYRLIARISIILNSAAGGEELTARCELNGTRLVKL